jgi:hypothetical protein
VKSRPTSTCFDFIAVLNHGAHDSVLGFAVVQIDANFVADFELSVIGLGGYGKNLRQLPAVGQHRPL